MVTRTAPNIDDVRNAPMYWFAILERARKENDFRRAADAIDELRRLGVNIHIRPNGEGNADG